MVERTPRQHETVTTMIDIAGRMADQTMQIARRDIDELGDVTLSVDERARLTDALLHIDKAAHDLHRLLES